MLCRRVLVSALTRHRTKASTAMVRIVEQRQPLGYPAFLTFSRQYLTKYVLVCVESTWNGEIRSDAP